MKLQDLLEEVSADEYKKARANKEAIKNSKREQEKEEVLLALKTKITSEMKDGNDKAYMLQGSELFDNKELESKLRDIYQDFIFSVKDIVTGKRITWQLKSEMPFIQKKEGLVGKFFRRAGGQ